MEVGGQRHAPADLPTGKRPSTHGIGGCVGPRAGLDRFGENIPHAGWGGGIRPPNRPVRNKWMCLGSTPSGPDTPRPQDRPFVHHVLY